MKKALKFWGIIALVTVMGFAVIACDNDNGNPPGGDLPGSDPTSISFTSYDTDNNAYTLVITKDPSRSVYNPQQGDVYVLTVIDKDGTTLGTSTGTVTSVSTSTLTLGKGNDTFTLTVSVSSITKITGDIPLDGGGTMPAPTVLTATNNNIKVTGEIGVLGTTYSGVVDIDGNSYSSTIEFNKIIEISFNPAIMNFEYNYININDIAPGSQIKVVNGSLTIDLKDVSNNYLISDETIGLFSTTIFCNESEDKILLWQDIANHSIVGFWYADRDSNYTMLIGTDNGFNIYAEWLLKKGWNTQIFTILPSYGAVMVSGVPSNDYKWTVTDNIYKNN